MIDPIEAMIKVARGELIASTPELDWLAFELKIANYRHAHPKVSRRPADNLCMIDKILKFEAGEMSDDEAVAFFQELVNTGLAWRLQGHYGRLARELIKQGLVVAPTQVLA